MRCKNESRMRRGFTIWTCSTLILGLTSQFRDRTWPLLTWHGDAEKSCDDDDASDAASGRRHVTHSRCQLVDFTKCRTRRRRREAPEKTAVARCPWLLQAHHSICAYTTYQRLLLTPTVVAWVKPGFHYQKWKPVTRQLEPLTRAVNSGSGNRALTMHYACWTFRWLPNAGEAMMPISAGCLIHVLSRVYTSATCCAATSCLLPAICCSSAQQFCWRQQACCLATCCAGVNAALRACRGSMSTLTRPGRWQHSAVKPRLHQIHVDRYKF